MSWGVYGILIIFGLFVLLMIFNPNLSCFGKRIRSPLYPLFRKKSRKIKTEDYGFRLVDKSTNKGFKKEGKKEEGRKIKKTDDYGFHLD
ncbi:MAG: hypothetical protein ACETWK_12380 [Candidatus Aminicenantaceae bacterium]